MIRRILCTALLAGLLATAWLWAATFRGYRARFVIGTEWQVLMAQARLVIVRDRQDESSALLRPLGQVSPPRLVFMPQGGWRAELPYWFILLIMATLAGTVFFWPAGTRSERRCRVCGVRLRRGGCDRCDPPVKDNSALK